MGGDGAAVAARAVADLADRLAVPASAIVVAATRTRTWPDAGLGCPEPGTTREPAPVEGSQVVLRHGGRVYLYHAGPDGQPFLCPSEDPDGGYEFVPPPGIDV